MEKKNVEALAPQICNMLPNGLKIEIFYWKFKSQVSLWFRAKSRLCSINCRFDPFSKDVLVVVGVAFFFIFTTFISHSLIPSFRNVCSVKNIFYPTIQHTNREQVKICFLETIHQVSMVDKKDMWWSFIQSSR